MLHSFWSRTSAAEGLPTEVPLRRTRARSITLLALISICLLQPALVRAEDPGLITILVDAFGQPSTLRQDWGFAALVEYGGKRILFDTGNNAELFAHNIESLQVDLTKLDFVVISHRHGDHTDGLRHLLKVNPRVKIYVPDDEYFGGPTPPAFLRRGVASLPDHMRYFNGDVPAEVPHGSPWRDANIIRVDSVAEPLPGFRLTRNIAPSGPFSETPELSLTIDTPHGQVVLVGCSHPGIERILGSVSAVEKPVRLLVGGLHLVTAPEAEIVSLVDSLRHGWKVGQIAPGHCTGELAFAALQQMFGAAYVYAGVGSAIGISSTDRRAVDPI